MKIPISWLKEYVDADLPAKELAHRLTMAGLETGDVEVIGEQWDNITVGLVVKAEQHPNADRLKLATVDLGNERITVVCGGPNLAEGQKIAFAGLGAHLINPQSGKLEKLKEANIRGVASRGMVCSERELGLGEDHDGILVLDDGAPVGTPLIEYLGDTVLDTEVTPNRPDWLSMLGVAYEVAALSGGGVREPDVSYPEVEPAIEQEVKVFIDDPDLAPRYTASLIKGVKVEPSPQWLQDRLIKAGQRPINNLVDITNYVMLEYGQPLHAFDFDTLGEGVIRVRRAKPGEALTSIDGEQRKLTEDMLAIADAEKAVAIAGVMGGAETEVTQKTRNVLLESANFNPTSIRRTASALQMRTEASYRFERGLNPELAPVALRRATQLIQQIAGGQVSKGIADAYPGKADSATVRFSMDRVEKVLGVRFSLEDTERVLGSLGFTFQSKGQDVLEVEPPYWRSDISIEDDLVEELARTTGYDTIPTTFLGTSIPQHHRQPERELRERVKDLLVETGLQEVISYALTSHGTLEMAEALGEVEPLTLRNPMSPEQQYLRTSLRGSLLSTLEMNQRYGQQSIRLFEVGRVYLPVRDGLPEERELAVGVVWGDRTPLSWTDQGGKVGFFDAKGVVQALMSGLDVQEEYTAIQDPLLHPGRTASITVAGEQVGVVGEVKPEVQEGFGISSGAVAMFEVDLAKLLPLLPEDMLRFASLPRFPGSYRDLALVVDSHVPAAKLEALIEKHNLVDTVTIFDVYTGKGVPEGKRSIAARINFQSKRKTLTAEAVSAAQEQIMRQLAEETGAELRG